MKIILDVVRDIQESQRSPQPSRIDESTRLYGPDGLFDSVGLVSVILAVEQDVSDAAGVPITIADDRAMSQTRSPFQTVGSLATYTEGLLKEARA